MESKLTSPDHNEGQFADQLTIETPEQTALQFPLAGIGSRFLALAFDTLLQFLAGIVLFFLFLFDGTTLFSGSQAGTWAVAVLLILVFLIYYGYFAIFEAVWNGQTPGKRQFKLRVIQDDGRPITVYQAISRNLLRIVDQLPGVYGVAIVVSLLGRHNKRLGDYVAGTVVVHEQEVAKLGPDWTKEARPAPAGIFLNSTKLTPEELQLIEAFLTRRSHMEADLRLRMARQIAERIGQKLQIPIEERKYPEAFLEGVALDSRKSAGYN